MRFVSIISTHTTLVGGDVGGIAGNEHVLISIHTILADRDKKAPVRSVQRREFQSTPPLRVETHSRDSHKRIWQKNEEQDQKLENHEGRITRLEADRK